MRTYQHVEDIAGEVVYGDFPGNLRYLTSNRPICTELIELDLDKKKCKAKFYFHESELGTLRLLTLEEKYLNSSKLFRDLAEMSIHTMQSMFLFKNKISLENNNYVQELIHNLTSLNSYNIQDLFSLIPQQVLTNNINKQHEVIRGILVEQPNVAITTLLKAIKNNLAMKVEFSVFEKTIASNPPLQKIEYSIRGLILSVLQIFIDDFEAQNITVQVVSSEKKLSVDYDTFFVSLYYILENATKYCLRSTELSIIFKEEPACFSIIFKMISVRIEEYEKNKLFNKLYRGEHAKTLTQKGTGIGMNRILKTLKLNNAQIEILPRVSSYAKEHKNVLFEHNEFKIKFPGQQDWFVVNQVR